MVSKSLFAFHRAEVAREKRESNCANCATVPSGTNMQNSSKMRFFDDFSDSVPIGTVAQLAHLTDISSCQTFSDKLNWSDFPTFLAPIFESQADAVGGSAEPAEPMLGDMIARYSVLDRPRYGIYRKLGKPAVCESQPSCLTIQSKILMNRKDMDNFIIRAYGKRELAMLNFLNLHPVGDSNLVPSNQTRFRFW